MMVVWRLFFVAGLPLVAQSWIPIDSGTTANLRAVSARGQTVWVSGDKGTVRKTTDGGTTWRDAVLGPPVSRSAWQEWRAEWNAAPGGHDLLARATDASGDAQPLVQRRDPLGYENNAAQPVRIYAR